MNILGTGLSGLIGTRIVELLSQLFTFQDLSFATGVDIRDKDAVMRKIKESDAPWMFHFAAVTDVDGSEKERALGHKSNSWIVNVEATKTIVEACRVSGKRLLYLSTDFVFDGTKDVYTENDTPNPQGWYAVTKYEAEQYVSSLKEQGLIVRIAFPYCAFNPTKKDFLHRMLEELKSGNIVSSPSDQIFVPTFIDDIALALNNLVNRNAGGIYHVVGTGALSPFEAAQKLAFALGYPKSTVKPTTFARFYQHRSLRPFHANLSNDKITKFGIHMSTFDEGLEAIKSDLIKNYTV